MAWGLEGSQQRRSWCTADFGVPPTSSYQTTRSQKCHSLWRKSRADREEAMNRAPDNGGGVGHPGSVDRGVKQARRKADGGVKVEQEWRMLRQEKEEWGGVPGKR